MAIGHINLDIRLKAKNLNSELSKIKKQFANTIGSIKDMFTSTKLGSFLMAGANDTINEYMAKVRLLANLNEQGFGSQQSERLLDISDKFEQIGYNAEMATDSFTQFIITGRATPLQTLGIYLNAQTKSTLAAANAQERLNWVLNNGNKQMQEQAKNMPKHIKNQLQLKKAVDDTKKALGASFLKVVHGIVNALGGLDNALKAAIAAFTVYKIAMIVGNVGIGISKAIAQGGVFGAPVAIAMGAGALAAIGALVGAASIATASINSNSASKATNNTVETPPVNVNTEFIVNVSSDRFGNEINQGSGK